MIPRTPIGIAWMGYFFALHFASPSETRSFEIIRWIHGSSGEKIDLIRLVEVHWRVTYSDHLPLLFKIDLAKRTQVKNEDSHA